MIEFRPLEYITPSTVSTLERCFLQVAFRANSTLPTFRPPAVRLGTACHALLERVAKGELADEHPENWSLELEVIWRKEISKQENALLVSEQEKHFGKAETWPQYGIQRARVFLKAEKLLSHQKSGSPHVQQHGYSGVERYYKAFQGRLRGRIDVVYESSQGVELIDYKTGNIFDEDGTGGPMVKEVYKHQLHLYAAMHHDCTGVWPVRGHLVPLTGNPVSFSIDTAEAEQLVQSAMHRMEVFNERVSKTTQMSDLANPTVNSCRYCEYKAYCSAFWNYHHESSAWEETAHLEIVALDVNQNQLGEFVVLLQVTAGTLSNGEYVCHTNRLGGLAISRRARLVNVRIRDDDHPPVLRINDYTTIYPLTI